MSFLSSLRRSKDGAGQRGFTLVEIIVALMIFSIVAVVALAALVKIIDANKKAQTIQDAVTNLSFALDSMSRELRTGSALYCMNNASPPSNTNSSYKSTKVSNCSGGVIGQSGGSNQGNSVTFSFLSTNISNTGPDSPCRLIYAYQIKSNNDGTWSMQKAEQQNCDDALNFSPVIDSSSVTINGFYVNASIPSSSGYPLAFIELNGSAGNKATTQTYFTVQTAASPRLP